MISSPLFAKMRAQSDAASLGEPKEGAQDEREDGHVDELVRVMLPPTRTDGPELSSQNAFVVRLYFLKLELLPLVNWAVAARSAQCSGRQHLAPLAAQSQLNLPALVTPLCRAA